VFLIRLYFFIALLVIGKMINFESFLKPTMKQIKLLFPVCLIFLLIHSITVAQTADSITFIPDRPGIATPPDILSFERIQIENGNTFENYFDGTAHQQNFYVPALLFRIGLLKNAEARISTDYAYKIETDSGIKTNMKGFDPITLGTKIKLFKQHVVIPKTSVLVNLTLPWYGKTEFKPDYLALSAFLLMSNSVSGVMTVTYNYGLIWDGNLSPVTQLYAICLGANLDKRFSIFIEHYGYISKYVKPRLYYDAGMAFQINNHFQIDVSAAGQIDSDNDYYTVNVGCAWQIVTKKMKF
jgi:hypothetical protein